MAEFAYNNTLHTSTSVTPFFANYGFHPRFSIAIPASFVNPSAEERARLMNEVHHDLSLELSIAQGRHKEKVDRHRQAIPDFKVGDTWSSYYVSIFQQLAHATNLTTKSWVYSASLTKSTMWLFVLLFHHTTEFTISSTHHFLSSNIHLQFQEEVSSHPSLWLWRPGMSMKSRLF